MQVALCTSSFRESCYAVLEGTGLAALLPVDRRVTLDDIAQADAKPEPVPYKLAAAKLGVSPARMQVCVWIVFS